jgi:hypothetical protein
MRAFTLAQIDSILGRPQTSRKRATGTELDLIRSRPTRGGA